MPNESDNIDFAPVRVGTWDFVMAEMKIKSVELFLNDLHESIPVRKFISELDLDPWREIENPEDHADSDDYWEARTRRAMVDDYDGLLFGSILVMLHSVLEDYLEAFSEKVRSPLSIPTRWQDRKDRRPKLEKIAAYLRQEAGMILPTRWSELIVLRSIRNAIVHNGSMIKNRTDMKRVANLAGVTLQKSGRLVIAKDYCDNSIAMVGEVINAVDLQWPEAH